MMTGGDSQKLFSNLQDDVKRIHPTPHSTLRDIPTVSLDTIKLHDSHDVVHLSNQTSFSGKVYNRVSEKGPRGKVPEK